MPLKDVLHSARELYRQAKFADEIALLESTLASTEHLEEFEARARLHVELSRVKRTAGLYDQCMQSLEKALNLTSSPAVMVEIWNEQGQLFDAVGKYSEAVPLMQNALSVARNSLPAKTPLTGEVLTTLSLAYLRVGEVQNCIASSEEARSILLETVGESDERYACALEHQGLALLFAGKLSEPESLHRRTLQIRTEYFGPDHPEIAFSLLNMASTLQAGGKVEGLEDLLKKAVSIFRKHYGEENSLTATAVNNLGGFYLEHGKFEEAATQFELSLAIKERLFGKEDTESVRNVLRNLGIAYSRLGRQGEARECLNRANAVMKKLSTNRIDIDMMLQMADDLLSKKKHKEAIELLTRALEQCEKEHGQSSPKTAQVLKFLGVAFMEQDPEQAKTYLIRSLQINKHEFGKQHPRVAEVIEPLATCFLVQGDNSTFRLLQQQAQHIAAVAKLPTAEEKLATTMLAQYNQTGGSPHFIVSMLLQMGREEEADALTESFIQRQEAEGVGRKELARELVTIGTFEMGIKRLEKAVERFQLAIKIYQDLPDAVADTIGALRVLSFTLSDMEKYDDAKIACQQMIALQETKDGPNHWSLRNSLLRLQHIEEKSGNPAAVEKVKQRLAGLGEVDPIEEQARSQAHLQEVMQNLTGPINDMITTLGTLSNLSEPGEPGELDRLMPEAEEQDTVTGSIIPQATEPFG